jgi:hypothetical protein
VSAHPRSLVHVKPVLQRRIFLVPHNLIERRAVVREDEIDLGGVHAVGQELVVAASDRHLDPIGMRGSQPVPLGFPGRVPHEHERARLLDRSVVVVRGGNEAGRRLLLLGWDREVEILGPFDHVRPRCDEEPTVVLVMTFGGSFRYGSGRRQCETVGKVAGDLGETNDERPVVRRFQTDDGIRLIRVVVEPTDLRVVEAVALHPGAGFPLQRPNDVLRADRRVLERRRVANLPLQAEGPCRSVARNLRHALGQIGPHLGAALLRRPPVVRIERPREAAPRQLPRRWEEIRVWIQVEEEGVLVRNGHPQRPTSQRRIRIRRPHPSLIAGCAACDDEEHDD